MRSVVSFGRLVLLVVAGVFCVPRSGSAKVMAGTAPRVAYPFYLRLPAGLTPDDLRHPDARTVQLIHQAAKAELSALPGVASHAREDLIVVVTDRSGRPILPDREAAAPGNPNNRLRFTFNSPVYPWTPAELDSLQAWLADFQPAARIVYGPPAYDIRVNCSKDPTIGVAGFYNPSTNEMVLHDLDTSDPVCHEMIHAFRDDAIIGLSSFEEGMTRAAEVAVFNLLDTYTHWDEHHFQDYDVLYDMFNKPAIAAINGNLLASATNTFFRYQLAGYAWAKPYLEDPAFFTDFNAGYFAQFAADPSIAVSETRLVALFRSVRPTVENLDSGDWYRRQQVLFTQPPLGYVIYQKVANEYDGGSATYVDYFVRETSGLETPIQGAAVSWQVYDDRDVMVDSGTATTNAFGVCDFTAAIPLEYVGRLKVVTSVASPSGRLTDVTWRSHGRISGIFGVVWEDVVGDVTAEPLDAGGGPVTTSLSRGCFDLPSLASASGRFRVTCHYPGGRIASRVITKDASRYYVIPDLLEVAAVAPAAPRPPSFWACPTVTTGAVRFAFGGGAAALVIYDVAGRERRRLEVRNGASETTWDGADTNGRQVESGVYLARLTGPGASGEARVVVLR